MTVEEKKERGEKEDKKLPSPREVAKQAYIYARRELPRRLDPTYPLKRALTYMVAPRAGAKSLVMSIAFLGAMYVLASLEPNFYNAFGPGAYVTYPFFLAMWTVLYLATYSTVSAILLTVAGTLYHSAGLRATRIDATAITFYLLGTLLYMATCKFVVGIVANYGFSIAVVASLYMAVYLAPSLLATITFTGLGLVLVLVFILLLILVGIPAILSVVVMAIFAIFSFLWSGYAVGVTPLWRVLAVWMLLAAKALLPPQVVYLVACGYAIYAGIEASLGAVEAGRYGLLNALPAVVLVAVTPLDTVAGATETVASIVDTLYMNLGVESPTLETATAIAKWILSAVPP